MPNQPLFTPYRMGDLDLANRIVMAPLTRMRAQSHDHVPTTLQAQYYAQRASAGLIIAEATAISPEGFGWADTPGLWTKEQVRGWRRVTDAVHAVGGRIIDGEEGAGLGIIKPHGVRIILEECAVMLLAVPQRFQGLLPLADARGQNQHRDGHDHEKRFEEDHALLHGGAGERANAVQRAPDADEGNQQRGRHRAAQAETN